MKNSIYASIEADEIIIAATREAFAHLASVCSRLASLSDAELQTPANHFHFMPSMRNTLPGSRPLVLQAVGETPLADAHQQV
jgi:CelD/BcsL family acetyltransferase involved in cellulose biosynthesis